MSRSRISTLVTLVLAAVALGGCGGSSGSPDGATLRGTTSSFPDYLDPALSITLEGWSAMWNTYVPLLTYEHADGQAGTRLIPGLARSMPRISDGGRTYTLHLRRGLRYSDGETVRASDFRHSIERVLTLNSGGSPFFSDIVGAERFARTKRGGIPGIGTDDASGRITIRLREPRGTFPYELATLFAAPLPGDTPMEDLSADPPPATGPYEIVDSHPGRGWEYRRNPEWRGVNAELMPKLPGGHVDRIAIEVLPNPETQVNDVEEGNVDWMVDPPPGDRLADLERKLGDRVLVAQQIDVYYFWMNTRTPPFDDLRVRRAVNYAIDPEALRRIYSGAMTPLQQILPAAMPGHRTFTPYPHDLRRARALIAAADPSDRTVTVWTDNFGPNLQAAEYYEGVLRELGFDTTLKVLAPANYFTVIGNRSTPDLDTGFGNWLLDYPHPNDYFEPQLTGGALRATNNTNWSGFDDPRLDAEVARLRRQQLGPAQERAYARLDRQYMAQAPWAPFGTVSLATLVGSSVDPESVILSPIYGQDLSSFRLR